MFETVSATLSSRMDSNDVESSRLTEQAKEHEQCKTNPGQLPTSSTKSNDILSMLTSAQDKFQETVRHRANFTPTPTFDVRLETQTGEQH